MDYILRAGVTATYIRCADSETDNERRMKLRERGLAGLKILELKVPAPEIRDDKRKFKEWKANTEPPKYIYDVGQLFLHRHGRDRHELFQTQFNVVIDVSKARKPVWLLLRPEYEAIELKKREEKGSRSPFPSRACGLNGVAIAKLAETIDDLNFCHDASDKKSTSKFLAADQLVASTYFKGRTTLEFFTPDIEHLGSSVSTGWREV